MSEINIQSEEGPDGNLKFKSSVFASYFSETHQRLIELYNAFSTVKYPAETNLEINTLKNALFYGFINDISFVLNNMLIVLIEHQSTRNPNMPFRLLQYIVEILNFRYKDPEPFYRSTLQKIEKIRCFVLYNGKEDQPDKVILRLSDAYKQVVDDISDPDLEVQLELIVPVYNINLGKNPEILTKSQSLHDYSQFIAKVNEERAAGKNLTQAIKAAIKYCLEHNIMAEYLKKHEAEVCNMLFQEFTYKDYARVSREEGIEIGIEKGIEKSIEAIMMIKANKSDLEIHEMTELSFSEIQKLRELYA